MPQTTRRVLAVACLNKHLPQQNMHRGSIMGPVSHHMGLPLTPLRRLHKNRCLRDQKSKLERTPFCSRNCCRQSIKSNMFCRRRAQSAVGSRRKMHIYLVLRTPGRVCTVRGSVATIYWNYIGMSR